MAPIPESIGNAVREYVSELSKEIPVQKAILFGSYAKGNYTKDSDVDLAIFSDYFEGTSRIDGIKFLLSMARKYIGWTFNQFLLLTGIILNEMDLRPK